MKIQPMVLAGILALTLPVAALASSQGCANMKACETSCKNAASYARTKKGAAYKEVVKKAEDCAELCRVSGNFMERKSAMSEKLAALCAEACAGCAKACEATKDKALAACIDSCKKCSDCCSADGDGKAMATVNSKYAASALALNSNIQALLHSCCKK